MSKQDRFTKVTRFTDNGWVVMTKSLNVVQVATVNSYFNLYSSY